MAFTLTEEQIEELTSSTCIDFIAGEIQEHYRRLALLYETPTGKPFPIEPPTREEAWDAARAIYRDMKAHPEKYKDEHGDSDDE
jgi:hypothetical protein